MQFNYALNKLKKEIKENKIGFLSENYGNPIKEFIDKNPQRTFEDFLIHENKIGHIYFLKRRK